MSKSVSCCSLGKGKFGAVWGMMLWKETKEGWRKYRQPRDIDIDRRGRCWISKRREILKSCKIRWRAYQICGSLNLRSVSPLLLVCITSSLFKIQTPSHSEMMLSAYRVPSDAFPFGCAQWYHDFSHTLTPVTASRALTPPWGLGLCKTPEHSSAPSLLSVPTSVHIVPLHTASWVHSSMNIPHRLFLWVPNVTEGMKDRGDRQGKTAQSKFQPGKRRWL